MRASVLLLTLCSCCCWAAVVAAADDATAQPQQAEASDSHTVEGYEQVVERLSAFIRQQIADKQIPALSIAVMFSVALVMVVALSSRRGMRSEPAT